MAALSPILSRSSSSCSSSVPGPSSLEKGSKKSEKKEDKTIDVANKALNQPLASKALLDKYDPPPPPPKVWRRHPSQLWEGYKGEIAPTFYEPQYVLIQDVAKKILFSQKSVSDCFEYDGEDLPLSELADSMFLRFMRNFALDIVDWGTGLFTSVDNRRLLIAKKIAQYDSTYGIWVKVHSHNQPLKHWEERRFTVNWLKPKTWGEAIKIRGDMKGKQIGYCKFPTILSNKSGNWEEAKSQKIPLKTSDINLSPLEMEDRKKIRNESSRGELLI